MAYGSPWNVIWLDEVGSTNQELRRLAAEGSPEWTVVVADRQAAGRGRLGRSWHSDGSWGLWASVLLRPEIPPMKAPFFGIIAALAVAHTIRGLTGLDVRVKWPNDVEAGGLKICGVLAESALDGNKLKWIVIGMGINLLEPAVPMPDEIAARATTVEKLSGIRLIREDTLVRLLKELYGLYNIYLKDGSAGILAEAGALSSIEGLDITVLSQEGTFEARAVGMDEYGALIVKDEAGALRRLLSAEVSVRRS